MSLAFSSDGQKLMVGSDIGRVKVWDLAGRSQEVTLEGHMQQVRGLALLPDGRTLVSAARDIRFWDLNSGRRLFQTSEDSLSLPAEFSCV
jgi:WD40 repeat protein